MESCLARTVMSVTNSRFARRITVTISIWGLAFAALNSIGTQLTESSRQIHSEKFSTALLASYHQMAADPSYKHNEDVKISHALLNFSYRLEPWILQTDVQYEKCCKNMPEPSWEMVAFVKSAARNYRHRNMLRRTWTSVRYLDGAKFTAVFLIGAADPFTSGLLEEEHARFGDLLQFEGSDEYSNITQKTLAGMQWAASNLPEGYFYSSVDDDFLVDMQKWKTSIDLNIVERVRQGWPEFPLVCVHRLVHWQPERNSSETWYLSEREYKWPWFPTACLGGMYSASVRVVSQLWEVCRYESKQLFTDDIWITGIMRQKLGMPTEMIVPGLQGTASHYDAYRKSPGLTVYAMHAAWRKQLDLLKPKQHCACEFKMSSLL